MAGEESRQCPHFSISEGVCGCPEFWQPAQRPQHDHSPSELHKAASARSSHRAPTSEGSLSVNSTPLPDCTKVHQATPAPPGPPKETCFFWYHGSCRRGDECDRPHEAHSTWPIPSPPGFRHYQPCTLPLCPLREDLTSAGKPQEYQRRRRTIGGQMDGAVFSRVRSAGESSSDDDTDANISTDMSETIEDACMPLTGEVLGLPSRVSSPSQVILHGRDADEAAQTSEVKAQDMERNGFDESDYVRLSLFPSPLSSPLVKEETVLSISHPGTLIKRRRTFTTESPTSNNKRVKYENISARELENVASLLECPRKMSHWDIKSHSLGLDVQHVEPAVPFDAALHDFSTQPPARPRAIDNTFASHILTPFDPLKGPRSMSTLPPICFFYYHKGYCMPKQGRRCDYLHRIKTTQQTVSLPHGIDNHDPLCPLPLCPVRLRMIGQVEYEQTPSAQDTPTDNEFEPLTMPHANGQRILEVSDPSPNSSVIPARGKPPGVTTGRSLPQHTGSEKKDATELEKYTKRMRDERGMEYTLAASALEAIHQRQGGGHSKRQKRDANKLKQPLADAGKKLQLQTEERASTKQVPASIPDALTTQQPLPSLSLIYAPTPTHMLPGSVQRRERPRHRNKNKPQKQLNEEICVEYLSESTRKVYPRSSASWPFPDLLPRPDAPGQLLIDNDDQATKGKARETAVAMDQGAQERRQSTTNHHQVPDRDIMSHEYTQETVGLSSEERREKIRAEQHARRDAWFERQQMEREEKRIARDASAHLAANARSADSLDRYNAGCDGPVERQRCQRCRYMKKGCDRTQGERPCLRCKNAGIGAEDCVDWHPDSHRDKHRQENDVSAQNLVAYQLPEGDQRLDWDTDLIRRLFGEIE